MTSFFRDLESFECLKNVVFPRLVQGRQANETIRVWVAVAPREKRHSRLPYRYRNSSARKGAAFPVQIFASDISLPAIEKARSGRYLENISEDISPERLNRFFTKIEGGYQIDKTLREMCVFTRHNLIDDPPFSKLDLISCRNVLIYLGRVQKDILSTLPLRAQA